MNEIKDILSEKGIPPSFHRMKIYEYLRGTKSHPTADLIYIEIKKAIPTISKTTIYNTLKTFAEHGLVTPITIEENEVRFDGDISLHGHFKCKTCGNVYDFPVQITNHDLSRGLDGHTVHESHIYAHGICKNCIV